MPDNKNKKAPQDANRVNIHEPYEVEYWTKKWGCTSQQLKDCVGKVGTSAAAVQKCLGK